MNRENKLPDIDCKSSDRDRKSSDIDCKSSDSSDIDCKSSDIDRKASDSSDIDCKSSDRAGKISGSSSLLSNQKNPASAGGRKVSGGKVFSNLLWRFSERIGVKLITTVVSLILARLLAPEAYGTVTLVLVITDILQVFVESGFGTALIQKKDADDLDFSSVFFFNVVWCVFLYLILFLSAPTIANLYGKPELKNIIRVVGIILIVSGVRNVQQAYVSRNMLFRRFFFSTLGGTIVGAVAGVYMAYAGYGVWAYVAQYLLNNIVGTVILWATVSWRPKLQFSLARLKRLFVYGWKLLASGLLNTFFDKLRQLIIGKRYDSSSLSFYNQGVVFPNLIVENVNTSIDSVLLPALSAEQDSKEAVKAMTQRAVSVSSYILWPMMMGLLAIAEPAVQLLLGEDWMPCVPYIRIFCLYYALFPIHTANLNAMKAMGRSDIFLKLELAKKALDLAVVFCTLKFGALTMALGLLAEGFINLFINSIPNAKLIDYPFREQIRDLYPSFLLSAAMGAAVLALSLLPLGSLAVLLLQIVAGVVIYIGGSCLFHLKTFEYLRKIGMAFLSRKTAGGIPS